MVFLNKLHFFKGRFSVFCEKSVSVFMISSPGCKVGIFVCYTRVTWDTSGERKVWFYRFTLEIFHKPKLMAWKFYINKFLSKHLQNDGHHFGSLAIKFRGCVQLKNKNLPGADSQQTHGLGFPGV